MITFQQLNKAFPGTRKRHEHLDKASLVEKYHQIRDWETWNERPKNLLRPEEILRIIKG